MFPTGVTAAAVPVPNTSRRRPEARAASTWPCGRVWASVGHLRQGDGALLHGHPLHGAAQLHHRLARHPGQHLRQGAAVVPDTELLTVPLRRVGVTRVM